MKLTHLIFAMLFVLLLTGCTQNDQQIQDMQSQIDNLQNTVNQQNQKITSLEDSITNKDEIISDLQQQIENLNNPNDKLQVCPDEWYINKMPGSIDENTTAPLDPREYFGYKGERRELNEFDLEWVLFNCDTRPEVVI